MLTTVVRFKQIEEGRIALVVSVDPFGRNGAAYYQVYDTSTKTNRLALVSESKGSELEQCKRFDRVHHTQGEDNA